MRRGAEDGDRLALWRRRSARAPPAPRCRPGAPSRASARWRDRDVAADTSCHTLLRACDLEMAPCKRPAQPAHMEMLAPSAARQTILRNNVRLVVKRVGKRKKITGPGNKSREPVDLHRHAQSTRQLFAQRPDKRIGRRLRKSARGPATSARSRQIGSVTNTTRRPQSPTSRGRWGRTPKRTRECVTN
jgi:hypothetical protein